MSAAPRSTRPNLLPRYVVLFVLFALYLTAVNLLIAFGSLPTWAEWPTITLTGFAGLFVLWRMLMDSADTGTWAKVVLWVIGGNLLGGAVATIESISTGAWVFGSPAQTVCGVIIVSIWTFVVLLALIRSVLKMPWAPLSVARAVIDEAVSQRVVVGLFGLILLLIPILPFVLSDDQPLRYRVQQFLGYSMGATTFLLSLFTVAFACWSLSSEIRDKQVFTTMVKPIGRAQYLIGKWLGLVLLNGVLLMVAGVGIAGFTVFYLAELPAQDNYDALTVREEVLAARIKTEPKPAQSFEEIVGVRLSELRRNQPQTLIDLGRSQAPEAAATMNEQMLLELGAEQAAQQLFEQTAKQWRSLGPRGTPNHAQVYVFEGLERAAEYGDVVYLRYKIKGATGNKTQVGIEVNGRRLAAIDAVMNIVLRYPIDARMVDSQGKLNIMLYNLNPAKSITFPVEDGLAVLHTVGGFGPNFLRAMLITWITLAFLAAVGLAFATFLGFAVALLGGFLFMFGIYISGFVLSSLSKLDMSKVAGVDDAIGFVFKLVGYAFTYPLSKFSSYAPVSNIVDGIYVGWSQVLNCLGWVGLVWTGVTGLIAWLIFRSRELARVQV